MSSSIYCCYCSSVVSDAWVEAETTELSKHFGFVARLGAGFGYGAQLGHEQTGNDHQPGTCPCSQSVCKAGSCSACLLQDLHRHLMGY